GVRIDGLPPERRGFGMVFQNYALFPHLTVGANVAFGLVLRSRGKAEIAERVRRMLELVRLTGFADRYPGQLSGGQQQRVAIARALAVEPRVLLLDEPLSNLDTKLRLEMRGEIKRLHADLGLTSIYVTHDQAEALSLSDRVVVLCDGRVIQAGPNVVRGTVRLTEYLGREHGVEVALEGGPTLTVSLAHPVAVGSALALRLPPERVVILPAEGDAR